MATRKELVLTNASVLEAGHAIHVRDSAAISAPAEIRAATAVTKVLNDVNADRERERTTEEGEKTLSVHIQITPAN